jgi:hypothetical protein
LADKHIQNNFFSVKKSGRKCSELPLSEKMADQEGLMELGTACAGGG